MIKLSGTEVGDDSQVDAEDSAFSGNSEGGALFKDQSDGSISSSRFSDNAAHGLYIFGSAAPVVTGSRFTGNGGRGVTVVNPIRQLLRLLMPS